MPIAKDLNMPLVVTNDVHYLRHGDHKPHDILLCIGTGKSVNDAQPPEVPRRSVLPEDRGADGGGLRRLPGGDEEHAADRRALQRHDPVRREPPAELRRARGLHARRLLRARRPPGLRAAPGAAAAARCGRQAAAHARAVRRAARLRDRDDQEDGVSRVLHDRLGLHPLRARAGHSGRSGPRLGRRQPCRLGAAHHRRRSAVLRPDFRALPQSRSACRCPISTSTSASGGAAK